MLAGGPESRAEVAAGGAAALLLSPTSAALDRLRAALGNSSRHQVTLSPPAPLSHPSPDPFWQQPSLSGASLTGR